MVHKTLTIFSWKRIISNFISARRADLSLPANVSPTGLATTSLLSAEPFLKEIRGVLPLLPAVTSSKKFAVASSLPAVTSPKRDPRSFLFSLQIPRLAGRSYLLHLPWTPCPADPYPLPAFRRSSCLLFRVTSSTPRLRIPVSLIPRIYRIKTGSISLLMHILISFHSVNTPIFIINGKCHSANVLCNFKMQRF